MEIFGSAFDDSVFLEARDRVRVSVSSYNAKLCEAQWFWDSAALDTDDPLEKQKVYKFRGDFAVRRGDYEKALEAYSCCLHWIADNNLTIRRDVLEGMSRCCTKLGQRGRALELADSLSKEASNTCHLTSLLLLKVSIHQHFGADEAKVSCLQQLCSLLPFNPWNWLSLGQTCLHLLDTHRTAGSCATDKLAEEQEGAGTEEPQQGAAEFTQDSIRLKACASFVRTRLLLRILQQQQASFVLQRSEDALREADEALQRLSPPEASCLALTEVMSEDLVPDKMREDYQDGESLGSVCLQSFRERWWDKILERGLLEGQGAEAAS